MIQIELIDTLPELNWSEQALFEMEHHGLDLLARTVVMYRLGDAGVLGLCLQSFFSRSWLWLLLADEIKVKDLKELRKECGRVPVGTLTSIQAGYTAGERFAEFFGFVPTGDSFTLSNMSYNIYRRV